MSLTAITLTKDKELSVEVQGVPRLVVKGAIRTPEELYRARALSLLKVKTERCFFLDDDDELPEGILEKIRKELGDEALLYTDELTRTEDGQEKVRKSSEYSQEAHKKDPLLVHHLVVMDTRKAVRAIKNLPVGTYMWEYLAYYEMAKAGARYLPETGYIWNLRPGSLRHMPFMGIAMMSAKIWHNGRK